MNKEFKSICKNVMICSREDCAELEYQESLPQYCDDIERVIKCNCENVITDYEYIGSTLKVYGKSRLSLVYISTVGCCRQAEFEETFTKNIDCPQTEHFAFASVHCSTRFTNLRLINQRKIDVHSSARVFTRIYERSDCSSMTSCENVITRKESVDALEMIACSSTAVTFDEEFTLPSGNNNIETVINTYSSIVVEEQKLIKDKMLVKSRIDLSVTYVSSDNVPQKSNFSINVSKIIDIDSVDETNIAFVSANTSSLFVKAAPDENNNMRKLQIAGSISLNYCIMAKIDNDYITDAYSTEYQSNCNKVQMPICKAPQYFADSKTVVATADYDDDDIVEIIDMNVSVINSYVEMSEIKYELQSDIMFYNSKSEIVCAVIKNEMTQPLDDSKREGICTYNLLSFDYVLKSSNSIELRINAEYAAYLYNKTVVDIISDIDVSESEAEESPVMTLYFACENESVWDIAKKFHTDSKLIMQENDMSTDTITNRRILLVPGV